MDPSTDTLPYIGKSPPSTPGSTYFLRGTNMKFDHLLQNAVKKWWKKPNRTERDLTKALAEDITNNTDIPFSALGEVKLLETNKQRGHVDILFTTAKELDKNAQSTPLMVIEVGLKGLDWWKKFDQGVKYLDRMRRGTQPVKCARFQKPLLLAVMTIDNERAKKSQSFVVRLGVFLCFRKNPDDDKDNFRMSLLWHSKTISLEDGSAMFGRLLWVLSVFSSWRDEEDELDYEYFSSNSCRVGDKVSGRV